MPDPRSLQEVLGDMGPLLDDRSDEYEEERRRLAAQDRDAAIRARMRILDGMPLTERDRELIRGHQLEPRMCLRVVQAWLPTERPWLILSGSVGRGKTLAAAWALTVVGGRYIGAREAERVFVARYGDEVDRQRELLRSYLLVIDDLQTERDAAGMEATLLALVDARRGKEKSILITNGTRAAFRKRYADPRLLSRLDESAQWLSESGEDMRRTE